MEKKISLCVYFQTSLKGTVKNDFLLSFNGMNHVE